MLTIQCGLRVQKMVCPGKKRLDMACRRRRRPRCRQGLSQADVGVFCTLAAAKHRLTSKATPTKTTSAALPISILEFSNFEHRAMTGVENISR